MKTLAQNADFEPDYLQKAREMKIMAAGTVDPSAREQLMALAKSYERLADHRADHS